MNQHFRRPWRCALPTPASWAGLQLPVGSTYHMAQTDVNNAFFRILARPGMSDYFILPSVSTQLLLQEGQIICCICLMCLHNFRSWLWFFSWALYFCQKMVESCVRIAGFSADALLMDRHRSPFDVSGFHLLRGLCERCLCGGLQPLEGCSCIGGCEGELGRCWLAVLRGWG